jgi:electron transfer flavoprotein alpha/beta subunit
VALLRRLRASPDGGTAAALLGPCEEAALGTALALRAAVQQGGGKATLEVLAVGPETDDEALAYALACGADEAFRIWSPALDGTDFYATAQVLAAAVRLRGSTWELCGDRSGDEALGATGPAVAEFLGVPHLTGARGVRLADEGALLVHHRGGDDVRELKVRPPAVLCVAEGPGPTPPCAPAGPAPAAKKRRSRKSAPQRLELSAIGIMAEQLRHRQRFLGAAEPHGASAEILPSAQALVERLKSDGLI